VRLRQHGWKIYRVDAQMTLHDAAMTRFSQWWKRSVRAGHAYAEGFAMHGASAERHGTKETRSNWSWGLALPMLIIATALIAVIGNAKLWWLVLAMSMLYPIQMIRIGLRSGSLAYGFFVVLGKFPRSEERRVG